MQARETGTPSGALDADLAGHCRSIDPAVLGERLRAARLAAGLTQAALAEGLVSAAYVSRIEVGNRRPDLELLRRLADRVGTSVEQLLQGIDPHELMALDLELDYAELEMRSGDPEAASRRIAAVLATPAGGRPGRLRVRAHSQLAWIHETNGRLDEALVLLEDVARHQPRDLEWVKTLIALVRCHKQNGDLAQAISVGEQALETVERWGLDGTTEAVQLAVTLSGAYWHRGDLRTALRVITGCVAEAERLGTPLALASAYWNASAFRNDIGELEAAASLARQAVVLMEQTESRRLLGGLHQMAAEMHLQLDPPLLAYAEDQLAKAEESLERHGGSFSLRMYVRYTAAHLALLTGRLEEAGRIAESLRGEADGLMPQGLVIADMLLGRVALARGDQAEARRRFLAASQENLALSHDRDGAQQWMELGSLLEQVGDVAAAMDAYRRAAAATGLVDPGARTLERIDLDEGSRQAADT